METPLSIIITTYNREQELNRCINSILEQEYTNYEIIVVDDNSSEMYMDKIKRAYPNVRYFYQEENRGPGAARNRGIKEAKYNYVIIMDDDDIFTPQAFKSINEFLSNPICESYPVFNFLCSNARLSSSSSNKYEIYSFRDLINGALVGDVTNIINREIFYFKEKYTFPDTKIGSELLLWFKIALEYGYPVINKTIVNVMNDSTERLTHTDQQLKKAELFVDYQVDILKQFEEEILKTGNFAFLLSKYRGVIIYSLLAGKRSLAFKYCMKSIKFSKKQLLFVPLLFMPKRIVIKLFEKYRERG